MLGKAQSLADSCGVNNDLKKSELYIVIKLNNGWDSDHHFMLRARVELIGKIEIRDCCLMT